MSEIEANEYVRTNNGKIDKVINDDYYMSLYLECENGLVEISNIVKHSKEIIDLIEVGDYVNGARILDITGDYIHTTEYDCCKARLKNKLESIVTHEQMSSIEYKV